MKMYSLKRSRQILRQTYLLFLKRKKTLPEEVSLLLKDALLALQEQILAKQRGKASELAHRVESLRSIHLRKSTLDQVRELVWALGFALVVAILVRQMWFEFYEIPSGSMRPTLKEQDRLAVSKTTFGINIPLTPKEFYFDPSLVQRNGIVIFTGEGMDIRDVDTLYFYLFPGKKQYVKRMIGKPGDILYFYGGEIFGIDATGNDISKELQIGSLTQIDHIPFIDFDRKLVLPPHPVNGVYSPVFIYQMNEPVAKLFANSSYRARGEMMPLTQVHDKNAPPIETYGDLWGFDNFAMARLLTREQVKTLSDQHPGEGVLYLELRHHPNLTNAQMVYDELGRLRPSLGIETSIVPLTQKHLETLLQQMYTARFEVKQGKAFRQGTKPSHFSPRMSGVPDGCYEFYYGKAYEVLWQGITCELPLSHPLYSVTPEHIQLLFNLGIEWDTRFSPQVKHQRLVPARYAYFKDQDLYVMGGPLLKRQDPTLEGFLSQEHAHKQASGNSYKPFEDKGPPLKSDGTLDVEKICHEGILIPEKMYLVLGDNHAMSADSREFGFVPESNLRGSPDCIFWPPGPRFGVPNQPPYPFVNLPRSIVWSLSALCIAGGWIYWRKRNRLPLPIN